jgi:hypothetical protein
VGHDWQKYLGEGGKPQTMSSARRMRKNLSLLILLPFLITSPLTFLVLPSFSQTIPVQGSFSDLTLELTAPKQNLVQLEPIPIILTLRNKTAYSIISQTTLDFAAGRVQLFIIEDNREPVRIQNISPIAKFVVVDPGPIRPGERRQTKELLNIALDKVFPQPGSYQIQAVLRDDREKQQIKSNLLTLRVLEPTGLDMQAFDYLKHRTNPSYFFSGLEAEKTESQLLEFVSNFRDSSYGDHAAFLLSHLYFARKDHQRLIEQLNGFRSDFIHADRVLYYLIEANVALNNWQQAGQHFDTLRASHPGSEYLERAAIAISRQPRRGERQIRK